MAKQIDEKGPSEERFITVSERWLDEIIKKAGEADFNYGKVLGMEYVIDALADAIKEWRSE